MDTSDEIGKSPVFEETRQEPLLPSIPERVLATLFKKRESNKNLNEPDVEEQFARLSLAFKTDKLTLGQRLELQQRQRDFAEKNIDCELQSLRESLNALNQLCTDSDMREVITKTQQHVDIVQQTTIRMSSRAETYGAIQQEQRMNSAFETMLNYVEHLKLLYDKEHIELEEYRRLLAEHNLLPEEKAANEALDEAKRILPPRSHSLSSSTKPEPRARLLSTVCILNNNEMFHTTANGLHSSSHLSLSPNSRRRSLPVGPMCSHVQPCPYKAVMLPESHSDTTVPTVEEDKERPETPKDSSPPTKPELNNSLSEDAVFFEFADTAEFLMQCSSTQRDSSEHQLLNYFSKEIEKEFSEYMASSSMNSNDDEADSEISSCFSDNEDTPTVVPTHSLSILKVLCNIVNQGVWRWDSHKVLLQLRYFLSVTFAIAAIMSLLLTVLPNASSVMSFLTILSIF